MLAAVRPAYMDDYDRLQVEMQVRAPPPPLPPAGCWRGWRAHAGSWQQRAAACDTLKLLTPGHVCRVLQGLWGAYLEKTRNLAYLEAQLAALQRAEAAAAGAADKRLRHMQRRFAWVTPARQLLVPRQPVAMHARMCLCSTIASRSSNAKPARSGASVPPGHCWASPRPGPAAPSPCRDAEQRMLRGEDDGAHLASAFDPSDSEGGDDSDAEPPPAPGGRPDQQRGGGWQQNGGGGGAQGRHGGPLAPGQVVGSLAGPEDDAASLEGDSGSDEEGAVSVAGSTASDASGF